MALAEAVALEGVLMKRSDTLRRWRSRWFFLPRGSSSLLYRASAVDQDLRGTLSLIHASVGILEAPASQSQWFCFFIQSPRGFYALAAESEAIRAKWMTLLDMAAAGASIQAAAWAAAAAAASCQVDLNSIPGRGPGPGLQYGRPGSEASGSGAQLQASRLPQESVGIGSVSSIGGNSGGSSGSQSVLPEGLGWTGAVRGPADSGEDGVHGGEVADAGRQDADTNECENEPAKNMAAAGTDGNNAGVHGSRVEQDLASFAEALGSEEEGVWEGESRGSEVASDSYDGLKAWPMAPGKQASQIDNDGHALAGTEAANGSAQEEKKGRRASLADAQASLFAAWTTLRDHPRTRSLTSLVASFGSAEASDAASCQNTTTTEPGLADGDRPKSPASDHSEKHQRLEGEGRVCEDRDGFEDGDWSLAEEAALEGPAGVGIQRAYFGLTGGPTTSRVPPGSEVLSDAGDPAEPSGADETQRASLGLTWLEGGAAATLDQHAAGHVQEPSQVWATEPRRGLLAQAKLWVKWEGAEAVDPGLLQQIQLKYENLAVTLERAAEALRAQECQVADLQAQAGLAAQELEKAEMRVREVQAQAAEQLVQARSKWVEELAAANQEAERLAETNHISLANEADSLRQQLRKAEETAETLHRLLQQERTEKERLQEMLQQGEPPVALAAFAQRVGQLASSEECKASPKEAGSANKGSVGKAEVALMKPFWAP